jgi:hypothetical protein
MRHFFQSPPPIARPYAMREPLSATDMPANARLPSVEIALGSRRTVGLASSEGAVHTTRWLCFPSLCNQK